MLSCATTLGAVLFGVASWPGLLDAGAPTQGAPSKPTNAVGTGSGHSNAKTEPLPRPATGTTSALPSAAASAPSSTATAADALTDGGDTTFQGDQRSVADDLAALTAPAPGEALDVLVRLNVTADASPSMVQQAATRLGEQLNLPVELVHGAGVVSVRADAHALAALATSALVAGVEADAWLAPALDRSTAQVGAPAAWKSGFTGAGRSVAIIDSGVDATHPALQGKVIHEACFSNTSCPNGAASMVGPGAAVPCQWGAGCEHGTHVAGVIAAGSPATATTPANASPANTNPFEPDRHGVAPGASVVAMQVFSQSTSAGCAPAPTCPRARTSDVLLALDHVLQLTTTKALAQPIVAVNLSLASDLTMTSCNDSILAPAIERLWAAGVATVVAAGNGSATTRLSVPACITSSVSVGALDQAGNVWSVSNSSPSLDYFAPGVSVVSTWPGARWQASSGTSTAAPHVAGAWAVTSQALGTTDPAAIDAWLRRQPSPVSIAGATVTRLSLAALASLAPPPSTTASASQPSGPLTDPFTDPLNGGLPVPIGPRAQPEMILIAPPSPATERRILIGVRHRT